MKNNNFYKNLLVHKLSISELLKRENAFQQIPNNWFVVITDIKGSTKAVQSGLSQVVNSISTGSIIAVLNIAFKVNIDIPFFFGGDGATIIVPPSLHQEIMNALTKYQTNVKEDFSIDLRVGSMEISEIYKTKYQLKIARIAINPLFSIPIVLGNGLQYAETIIKSQDLLTRPLDDETILLNLEGMECRWNKISPPKNANEVVCLIIYAVDEERQALVFRKVLDKLNVIYGPLKKRNPISLNKLELSGQLKKIRTELKIKQPSFTFWELLKNWIYLLVGKYLYLPSQTGQNYLTKLVQLSDIFTLDGQISMVISGVSSQRHELVTFLDQLESDKELVYGINVSQQSIISCYVRDRDSNHIHFIDGANGGYTRASIGLKEKMKRLV